MKEIKTIIIHYRFRNKDDSSPRYNIKISGDNLNLLAIKHNAGEILKNYVHTPNANWRAQVVFCEEYLETVHEERGWVKDE